MDTGDIKIYSKLLYEILMEKDRTFVNELRDLKLSAISNSLAFSENLMKIIRDKLNDWNINIQSFAYVTSNENALSTMLYLTETIQSDVSSEDVKMKNLKEILKKDRIAIDKLYDCLEGIPDLLTELNNRVISYNVSIDRRINLYKPLKDFASELYNILCTIKKHLNRIHNDQSDQLDASLTEQMKRLLELSIVISTYPPRTIKKGTVSKVGTHFKATVKCLIESEKFFYKEKLQPYFLTEMDLKDYVKGNVLRDDCAIKCVSNNLQSNVWELKNMLWSPPERLLKERKKSERITNSKAVIMIKFKASANPYLFQQFVIDTCLFSDAVVSIVHTNQEIEALITLFWDDYFRVDRSSFLETGLFKCRDTVPVQEFVDVLSRYFERETSRGLTVSNKEFIYHKLIRMTTNGLMSTNQFTTVTMHESTVSFGYWILSIIKLLKIPGPCELWKEDLIDGFIRKDVEPLFVGCPPGCFALRFSEKNAKIGVLLKTPENSLEAWNPFSADECRNRNLCERLMEFHELQFIRSATGQVVKKEEVLSSFIPNKHLDDGYTERGQLSRILCSNIYSDLNCLEDVDSQMDTDLLMDLQFDEDFISL